MQPATTSVLAKRPPARPNGRWIRLRQSRLAQALILIVFWQLGNVLARATALPVPGAIWGLFLVLVLLGTGALRLPAVHRGATWFLGDMLLFFVPPVLAVLDHPELAGWLGLKLLVAIVAGTVVVMTVTALTVDACYRFLGGRLGDAAQ